MQNFYIFLFSLLLLFSKTCIAQEEDLFVDERDSKIYKTVKIGEQVWLAENFNYIVANCPCYYDNSDYCNKFGRLYTWEAVKEACPKGWHLPSCSEWETLINFLGGFKKAGFKIVNGGNSKFNALMSGARLTDGKFDFLYDFGMYWTSTELQDSADIFLINLNRFTINKGVRLKTEALSVRFIKDTEPEGEKINSCADILAKIIDHFLFDMEAAAKHKAESVHTLSAIEYCTGEKYNFISQSDNYCEIEKIINVFMKGSLIGLKKFKVEISVVAAFENKGNNIWKPSVKNVKVISDTKIK